MIINKRTKYDCDRSYTKWENSLVGIYDTEMQRIPTSSIIVWSRTSVSTTVSSSPTTSHWSTSSVVSASSSAPAWFAGWLFHVDRRPLKVGIVKRFDRRRRVFLPCHVDEAVSIHHVALGHLAEAQEQLPQLIVATIFRQPADEYLRFPLRNTKRSSRIIITPTLGSSGKKFIMRCYKL